MDHFWWSRLRDALRRHVCADNENNRHKLAIYSANVGFAFTESRFRLMFCSLSMKFGRECEYFGIFDGEE
jgi:hypothetical protein